MDHFTAKGVSAKRYGLYGSQAELNPVGSVRNKAPVCRGELNIPIEWVNAAAVKNNEIFLLVEPGHGALKGNDAVFVPGVEAVGLENGAQRGVDDAVLENAPGIERRGLRNFTFR